MRRVAAGPVVAAGSVVARRDNQRRAREAVNWQVQWCGETMAKAVEPGGDVEVVFQGMVHPYDAALDYAAARLRGEPLP